jgi:hypothetical protein
MSAAEADPANAATAVRASTNFFMSKPSIFGVATDRSNGALAPIPEIQCQDYTQFHPKSCCGDSTPA